MVRCVGVNIHTFVTPKIPLDYVHSDKRILFNTYIKITFLNWFQFRYTVELSYGTKLFLQYIYFIKTLQKQTNYLFQFRCSRSNSIPQTGGTSLLFTKFMFWIGNKDQRPFLDVLVTGNCTKRLECDVFRKDDHSHISIPNNSHHCKPHEMASLNF